MNAKGAPIIYEHRRHRVHPDHAPPAVRNPLGRTGSACAALILLAIAAASGAAPRLDADTTLATAGYYQLHWSADTPDVAIEETTGNQPTTTRIYTGPDRAMLLSGLTDGRRTYRAGEIGTDGRIIAWSDPVTVTVAHHTLARALTFFAVGATVFFATLILIVHGTRRYR